MNTQSMSTSALETALKALPRNSTDREEIIAELEQRWDENTNYEGVSDTGYIPRCPNYHVA